MHPYPPQQPPPSQQGHAYLEVELSFFFMMWILYLITPALAINGMVHRIKWGKHQFTLPPGRYHVQAWYPYLFRSQTSPAQIVVDLHPGTVTRLRYRPAWLVFLDGSMTIAGQHMLGASPPPPGLSPPA